MKSLGIIPVRYDSTRFPGKALFVIDGKSMIRRVYEQASKCQDLSRVIVATDHEGILKHVHDFGGEAVMTASSHKTGTERCAEALELIRAAEKEDFELVVNIQGDEPYIYPEQISEVVYCFSNPSTVIATLARKIMNPEDITDPNVVKLVFDDHHRVLYFSRSPIPHWRNRSDEERVKEVHFFEHVGIYGFRNSLLQQVVKLPESSLERAESLEQLRWIQHGYPMFVHITEYESISIDTPSDLIKISNMKN
ncbi:MAG: 3-deoxy-manno-octulosonate cytidylyltransferase [Bacteroidales bacterium]|nr:3-deoxy-manno-octulosonate cytidylyltransferase [Bacteroidales bacterium]